MTVHVCIATDTYPMVKQILLKTAAYIFYKHRVEVTHH